MAVRRVAVLGSTGSIGTQALDVIRRSPALALHSIVCGSSRDALHRQTCDHSPAFSAVVSDGEPNQVFSRAIEGADVVLNAVVGSAGLLASLLAQEAGKPLALANKESLVVGSDLLKPHLEAKMVIPVDSEHSTVHRCLSGEARKPLSIMLTASGGSLRDLPLEELHNAPPEAVLAHPTWSMGGRITVDSATMVNKAFEVLEARALFPGIPVGVAVHRSSIVHSLVGCADGAWKALMGHPDMKVPISWALHYPDLASPVEAGDFPVDWGDLSFSELQKERYPAFAAVAGAGDLGGTAPAAANAADEVAVEAFLEGRIPFGHIASVVTGVLEKWNTLPVEDYSQLMEADGEARILARMEVERLCSL
jgi:1-deoxy-D-xylulose-5-phosphate reductoisomerase